MRIVLTLDQLEGLELDGHCWVRTDPNSPAEDGELRRQDLDLDHIARGPEGAYDLVAIGDVVYEVSIWPRRSASPPKPRRHGDAYGPLDNHADPRA